MAQKEQAPMQNDVPAPRPRAKPNTKESTASTAIIPCTPSSTGLTSTIERTSREPSLQTKNKLKSHGLTTSTSQLRSHEC